jgi:hypothetical protein
MRTVSVSAIITQIIDEALWSQPFSTNREERIAWFAWLTSHHYDPIPKTGRIYKIQQASIPISAEVIRLCPAGTTRKQSRRGYDNQACLKTHQALLSGNTPRNEKKWFGSIAHFLHEETRRKQGETEIEHSSTYSSLEQQKTRPCRRSSFSIYVSSGKDPTIQRAE